MWTTFFITEGNTDLNVWWQQLSEAFATERKDTKADQVPTLTPPSTPAMPNPDNPVLELPFDHYVLHNAKGELPKTAKKGRLLAAAEKAQDKTQQAQLKAGDTLAKLATEEVVRVDSLSLRGSVRNGIGRTRCEDVEEGKGLIRRICIGKSVVGVDDTSKFATRSPMVPSDILTSSLDILTSNRMRHDLNRSVPDNLQFHQAGCGVVYVCAAPTSDGSSDVAVTTAVGKEQGGAHAMDIVVSGTRWVYLIQPESEIRSLLTGYSVSTHAIPYSLPCTPPFHCPIRCTVRPIHCLMHCSASLLYSLFYSLLYSLLYSLDRPGALCTVQ
jgi:hypothetical protein